jgi:hypothetical protein
MGTLNMIVGALAFLIVGLIALAMPERLQRTSLRAYERSPVWLRPLYFPNYLRSRGYVIMARIIGVICILVAMTAVIVRFMAF